MFDNRLSFLFLILAAASTAIAQTGDALFSQPYDLDSADDAIQSVSIVDDFLPDIPGEVGSIELWMLFASGVPPTLTVSILQDNGSVNPNNASEIFSSNLDASINDTGDDFYGYDVYSAFLPVDDFLYLNGSTRYWLELSVPVGAYWICQTPLVFGSDMWLFSGGMYVDTETELGTKYDSFFEICQPVALSRDSWGSIKASF